MSDLSGPEHNQNPQPPPPPIVYASPTKRTWAWVGVIYVAASLFLFTYFLAKGEFLQGIGNLMVVPALWGLGSTAWYQHKAAPKRIPFLAALLTVTVCAAFSLWGLLTGIPALLRVLGG